MSVSVHLIHGSGLSVRDKFGWLSVEGADVPYILLELKEKFVPVKVIEKSILAYYPSVYPKEIEERPPLVCHYIKQEEVALLNKCCRQQGSPDKFTENDPVVKLSSFLDFFRVVKKAYPSVVVGRKIPADESTSAQRQSPASTTAASQVSSTAPVKVSQHNQGTDYGWLLMKDALVPYVIRNGVRFAPLNVIRGAAQLLLGVQMESTCATEPEIVCLNDMCRKVGLVFTFQKNTALADIKLVTQLCPGCSVQNLPKENPMDNVNASRQSADDGRPPASVSPYRPPPPLQRAPSAGSRANQQSATRSLQALAQMAKGSEVQMTETDKDYAKMTRPVPRTSGKQVNGVKVSTPPTQTGNKASNGHVLSVSPPPEVITTTETWQTTQTVASNVIIKPMECLGKTISCLIRGKTNVAYALVEAVCRVYFPNCSLVDFIHFLELDMAVTLYVLKKSEEETFIEFYGIPTKQLRCNQVIKLQDLRDRMGWLQKRFGETDNQDLAEVNGKEVESKAETEDQATGINEDVAMMNSGRCVGGSSPADEPTDDVVTMATNTILASADATLDGLSTNSNSNGKNKTLEHTIMRLLHDKNENCDEGPIGNGGESALEPSEEYKPDDNEYYPELGDRVSQSPNGVHSPDIAKSVEGPVDESPTAQQRAPSSNKRKGAPPRKCMVPVEKKLATLDTMDVETPFSEDCD